MLSFLSVSQYHTVKLKLSFSVCPRQGEDSNRVRPPVWRRKANEELEINMREWVISKWARHESVPQNDQGDGETNEHHCE